MSDPVAQAVSRALDADPWRSEYTANDMELSAREALKPIRAEFQNLRAKALASNDASFIAGLLLALTRLTPLLYTTEELSS